MQRDGQIALRLLDAADIVVWLIDEVALPLGIVRVLRRQALADVEAGAIGLQRAGQIALRLLDAADIVVAERQVALPRGIVRVLRRQALADVEAGAMGLQRAGQIALRLLDAADIVVADRQVALPLGIVRVLRRQALADVEAGAMGLQRAGQIALRPLDAADVLLVADRRSRAATRHCSGPAPPGVGGCRGWRDGTAARRSDRPAPAGCRRGPSSWLIDKVALPLGIVRVLRRQALADVAAGAIGLLYAHGQIALRPLDAADIVVADRQVALPPGIARVLRAASVG